MKMERTKLSERSEGKLRRALGMALRGEAKAQLERIAEDHRRRAKQGLGSIKGEGATISCQHIDDLSPLEMRLVTAAQREELGWLKERVERTKRGDDGPPIPTHLR